MPEIKFNKEQLDEMLAAVAVDITEMLKNESAALTKGAKDDAPAEESEGSEGPAAPEASAPEASGPPAGPEASAPEAGPPAEVAPPAGPEASAPAPAPGQGEIEPAPTVEQLQAEYSQLDPEQLKMHYLACKGALLASMGGGAGPEASAPAGPPAPPAGPPAGPEASAPPMAMGEKSGKQVVLGDAKGNGGKIEAGKMSKSEIEKDEKIAKLEKSQADQTEAVAQLAKVIETVLQPVRKSVKGISDVRFVARTEEPKVSPVSSLTKKEVTAKLREKARDIKLSKSDKDLISSYTVGGVDISKIEHLLKDAA